MFAIKHEVLTLFKYWYFLNLLRSLLYYILVYRCFSRCLSAAILQHHEKYTCLCIVVNNFIDIIKAFFFSRSFSVHL